MLAQLACAYESIAIARDPSVRLLFLGAAYMHQIPFHYESLLTRLWQLSFPMRPPPPWHTHLSSDESDSLTEPQPDGANSSMADVGWMALGFQVKNR